MDWRTGGARHKSDDRTHFLSLSRSLVCSSEAVPSFATGIPSCEGSVTQHVAGGRGVSASKFPLGCFSSPELQEPVKRRPERRPRSAAVGPQSESLIDRAVASTMTLNLKKIPALLPKPSCPVRPPRLGRHLIDLPLVAPPTHPKDGGNFPPERTGPRPKPQRGGRIVPVQAAQGRNFSASVGSGLPSTSSR